MYAEGSLMSNCVKLHVKIYHTVKYFLLLGLLKVMNGLHNNALGWLMLNEVKEICN